MTAQGARGSGAHGVSLGTFIAWGVCALLVGLAADILQPLGPFVAFLLGVFLAVAALCALLSFLPPLRGMMRPATVFALWGVAVFGGILAAQYYLAPRPQGTERGFLAASGPGEALQGLVLAEADRRAPEPPVEPVAEAALAPAPPVDSLDALRAALSDADPSKRMRATVQALTADDPAFLTAAIDLVYATREPALRREAIMRILARREGASIPLLVGQPPPGSEPLATALQGAVVRIDSVSVDAGAFEGAVCGTPGLSGSVNVSGVSLAGRCLIGEAMGRVTLELSPTDDFRLTGQARSDQGQTVSVTLPLR